MPSDIYLTLQCYQFTAIMGMSFRRKDEGTLLLQQQLSSTTKQKERKTGDELGDVLPISQ